MKKILYIVNVYLIALYFLISTLFDICVLKSPISIAKTVITTIIVFIVIAMCHLFVLKKKNVSIVKFNLGLLLFLSLFLFFSDWSRFLLSSPFVIRIVTTLSLGNTLVLFFLIAVFIVSVVLLYLARFDLKPIAVFTVFFCFFLIISKLFSFFTYKPTRVFLNTNVDSSLIVQKRIDVTKRSPDIFYVILDGYSSENSLNKYWHFNNSEFMTFLKQKGFYVAGESKTNYNVTIASLASSLNCSYINIKNGHLINKVESQDLYEMIDNNKIYNYLMSNGYEIMPYTIFDIDNHRAKTIKDWNPAQRVTLWDYVVGVWNRNTSQRMIGESFFQYNKNCFNYLDSCAEISISTNKPHFYFIHSLATHTPYVIDSLGVFTFEKSYNRDKYLESLKYSNKRITTFINNVLNKSQQKPIIIIQGDHGSHLNDIDESLTILNAYYFPDTKYDLLYKNISPVNSFRVLLNKYFNAKLSLLPDKQYNVSYY